MSGCHPTDLDGVKCNFFNIAMSEQEIVHTIDKILTEHKERLENIEDTIKFLFTHGKDINLRIRTLEESYQGLSAELRHVMDIVKLPILMVQTSKEEFKEKYPNIEEEK